MIKDLIKAALQCFDLALTHHSTLQMLWDRSEKLDANSKAHDDLSFLSHMPPHHVGQLFALMPKSQSQIRQDLFVLSQLDFKRGGFFVEFGATNGRDLSNTHLLEMEFDWTGILAEPAHLWQEPLRRNRSCRIDSRCVWSHSGQSLIFTEASNADMSTLAQFSGADHHAQARKTASSYEVQTISLQDLLRVHDAPPHIDYLSIDTEGSELEILRAFDFSRHTFGVITCEHNHAPVRTQLLELLSSKGYRRVFAQVSQFDDWYVGPGR